MRQLKYSYDEMVERSKIKTKARLFDALVSRKPLENKEQEAINKLMSSSGGLNVHYAYCYWEYYKIQVSLIDLDICGALKKGVVSFAEYCELDEKANKFVRESQKG
jgi:hypothetical protein